MRYLNLPKTLLLALYISSVGAVHPDGHRMLRAATRRSDLLKRDTRIVKKFHSELVYIEGEGRPNKEIFASTVKVSSKRPILHLEEIEHLLQDVQCQNGRLLLRFVNVDFARDARSACHGGHGGMGGLVITSHQSCNRDNERAVYKIDNVSFSEEGTALDLAVTETLWQDAFDNLDINFGNTLYDYTYRRHSDFPIARRKRRGEFSDILPADNPGNNTGVTLDVTSELLNYTFTAEDFLTGLDSIVNLPLTPDLPQEIGCKNCSTRGQIVLTQGAITIDPKQIDLIPDILEGGKDGKEINRVITGGHVDLAMIGMGAHLEIFARPTRTGSYQIKLPPIPILGFVIPGIGQAGASFEAKISADFEITKELAINYGIDVTIPDDVGIRVDLSHLTNTNITGFRGATLDALPFTPSVTNADFALSLAFIPTIPIGFEFSDKLSALVTISLDLPRLDAKLTNGAKDQCSLLSQEQKPRLEDADLDKRMLVEANASLVVDVVAELNLPLLPAPFDSAGTSANIFSTKRPLVTSCIHPIRGTPEMTRVVPTATIEADAAVAQGSTTSGCTNHRADRPWTCSKIVTTIYAITPTGGHASLPSVETALPLDETSHYPAAPATSSYDEGFPTKTTIVETEYGSIGQRLNSAPCTSSQTLRVTLSPTPVSTSLAFAPPPIVIISATRSKACNSSTLEISARSSTATAAPILITSGMKDAYSYPSSTTSHLSEPETEVQTRSDETSMLSTTSTSPTKVEESKGFLGSLHSVIDTTNVGTPTGPSVFTGAATPGALVPQVRTEAGWQIAILAASVGFGILLM